jgi:hypothetical protein
VGVLTDGRRPDAALLAATPSESAAFSAFYRRHVAAVLTYLASTRKNRRSGGARTTQVLFFAHNHQLLEMARETVPRDLLVEQSHVTVGPTRPCWPSQPHSSVRRDRTVTADCSPAGPLLSALDLPAFPTVEPDRAPQSQIWL